MFRDIIYISVFSILCSCTNQNRIDNDTKNNVSNTMYEKGQWISIKDTTNKSEYCLIDGHIYAGWIVSDEYNSARSFFQANKKYFPHLTDVDIETFEINKNEDNEPYARDKNKIYYPQLFNTEFFDGDTDGGEIYFGDISIKEADVKTFKYIGKGYAIDKNNMYYKGSKIQWNDSILDRFKVHR